MVRLIIDIGSDMSYFLLVLFKNGGSIRFMGYRLVVIWKYFYKGGGGEVIWKWM